MSLGSIDVTFGQAGSIELVGESFPIVVAAGGGGGTGGVGDHGALTGLGGDDHPQYHTDARGDARYYLKGQVDTALATKAAVGHGHASATTGVAGFMTGADKAKLDGIAAGATANSSDAILLARTSHTGTQAIATVSGLQTALDGKAAISHSHAIADATGLQTALDGKQAISSGQVAVHDLGTIATGTVTPEPSTGAMKKCIANGAFTLGALTETGAYLLEVTNGGTAGAIDLSAFTLVPSGDAYTTTSGKVYEFAVTNYGGVKRLQVVELA